jgi:hypothetical protein
MRNGLPSNAAFSKRTARIEGKVEFGGKVRGAWKSKAGTMIRQIADDTTKRRAVGQNDFGVLEYFGPWKPPTLKHARPSKLQFDENNFRPKLFHNRK